MPNQRPAEEPPPPPVPPGRLSCLSLFSESVTPHPPISCLSNLNAAMYSRTFEDCYIRAPLPARPPHPVQVAGWLGGWVVSPQRISETTAAPRPGWPWISLGRCSVGAGREQGAGGRTTRVDGAGSGRERHWTRARVEPRACPAVEATSQVIRPRGQGAGARALRAGVWREPEHRACLRGCRLSPGLAAEPSGSGRVGVIRVGRCILRETRWLGARWGPPFLLEQFRDAPPCSPACGQCGDGDCPLSCGSWTQLSPDPSKWCILLKNRFFYSAMTLLLVNVLNAAVSISDFIF